MKICKSIGNWSKGIGCVIRKWIPTNNSINPNNINIGNVTRHILVKNNWYLKYNLIKELLKRFKKKSLFKYTVKILK